MMTDGTQSFLVITTSSHPLAQCIEADTCCVRPNCLRVNVKTTVECKTVDVEVTKHNQLSVVQGELFEDC